MEDRCRGNSFRYSVLLPQPLQDPEFTFFFRRVTYRTSSSVEHTFS